MSAPTRRTISFLYNELTTMELVNHGCFGSFGNIELQNLANVEKLYKYTPSQWAAGITEKGIFRVGTLHEYKKYENKEIGDKGEGSKFFAFNNFKETLTLTPEDARSKLRLQGEGAASLEIFRKEMNRQIRPGENLDFPIGLEVVVPDCYIYCTTSVFDENVMRSFECDACIEISNPWRFFWEMSHAMQPHIIYGVMEKCEYETRSNLFSKHNNHRPQILKDKSMQHQREVRMLWDPKEVDPFWVDELVLLEPKIIKAPKARRYCKRIV